MKNSTNFRIIDVHTHAWPDKVADKAREYLEDLFKVKLVSSPTVDTLIEFMDRNQIDVSCLCAVASRPEQVPSINDWLFSVRSERLRIFCALHPEYEKWKEEIQRIREKGDGIKFQPEFQDFYVDDQNIFGIYEEIEKVGLPVLFHCGEELSGTMKVRSSPSRIRHVHERFPGLKIIAAHFGGFRMWDEVKKYLLGEDIYVDTAYFFRHLPEEDIKYFISHHPQERILFGTDFPLIDQKEDIDYLTHLDIPLSSKEKIFSLNAAQLLGINFS